VANRRTASIRARCIAAGYNARGFARKQPRAKVWTMADKTLLELPAAAALTGAETLLLVQGGNSRQAELVARLLPWLVTELDVAGSIDTAIDALIDGAPGTRDTLAEIAAALAADEGALAALTAVVGGKLAKASNLSDLPDIAAARRSLGSAPITTVAGAAYTLLLTDAEGDDRTTGGAATAITVPPEVDVPFPVSTVTAIRQAGAGLVTLVAGAGVTLNNRGGGLVSNGQHAGFQIKKVAANEWDVWGDIA